MNIAFWAGILFTVFGIYMLRHATTQHRKAAESLNWPATKGRMLKVSLWGKRNINGVMQDVNNLIVKYSYEAGGSEQQGSNAAFYTLMYPDTTEFAEKYPEGAEDEVYYDPHQPDESVLCPGPRAGKPHSDLLLGCVGVLTGLAISISAYMGWIG